MESKNRTIISVVGKDAVGIIVKACTYASQHKGHVLDIYQNITDGFFTMMMIVDTNTADESFGDIQKGLSEIGKEIGVDIRCQKEEIFEMMHRI